MKTWRGRRPAVKTPRAILSVGLLTAEFDEIDRAAEALGMYTSAFVRQAALDSARRVLDGVARMAPPEAPT